MYNQLIHYYQNIPPETWVAIFGAGTVSVVTQFGKKLLNLTNDKVIQVLFAVVAFAAAAGQYLVTDKNIPPTVLGLHTAALMGLATPLYFTVIKPANSFINDLKAFKASKTVSTPAADAAVAAVNPGPALTEPSAVDELIETGKGVPAEVTSPAEFQA